MLFALLLLLWLVFRLLWLLLLQFFVLLLVFWLSLLPLLLLVWPLLLMMMLLFQLSLLLLLLWWWCGWWFWCCWRVHAPVESCVRVFVERLHLRSKAPWSRCAGKRGSHREARMEDASSRAWKAFALEADTLLAEPSSAPPSRPLGSCAWGRLISNACRCKCWFGTVLRLLLTLACS